MMRRVVDTNVGIVANGRGTDASPTCRLAALEALDALLRTGSIVVDDAGEIEAEYRCYFRPSGQPGVGDRFYETLLKSFGGRRVVRVTLEKRADGSFADFPEDPDLARFDPSDRKFAATARKSRSKVLNATDSDWLEHAPALARNGIEVEFVCGVVKEAWTVR